MADEGRPSPKQIAYRTKQVQYGKNTEEYARLLREGPCEGMPRQTYLYLLYGPHPTTKRSKRTFKGAISAWRRKLHLWYDDTAHETSLDTKLALSDPPIHLDPRDGACPCADSKCGDKIYYTYVRRRIYFDDDDQEEEPPSHLHSG